MASTYLIDPNNIFAHYFKDTQLAPYLFALSKRMQEGHVCLNLNELTFDKEFWKEFDGNQIIKDDFPENSSLVGKTSNDNRPFVLANNKLYQSRNYFYETKIIDTLKELVGEEMAEFESRKRALLQQSDFLKKLQSKDSNLATFSSEEKPDWQLVAAIQSTLNNVTIVTGGPGTGKTTTVAKILALLNKVDPKLKITMTAPTGKAAARMKESLQASFTDERNKQFDIEGKVNKLDAKTIHRLLGAVYQSPFFKHNKENPLDFDVVIVDEASMIGVGLFAKLLDALKPSSRLIILGDSEQLASVDSGSLFGDLCTGLKPNENKFSKEQLHFVNSFLAKDRQLGQEYKLKNANTFLDEHLIRLKKTYRYDQDTKMGQFTKAVIKGEAEKLENVLALNDESLILDQAYDEGLFNTFIKGYKEFIEEEDIKQALRKLNHCRVLCALRQGSQGVYRINTQIESLLKASFNRKKDDKGISYFNPSDGFYHNQPIMVTKNTPQIGLFNGDVGIVRKNAEGRLKAHFVNAKKEKNRKEFISINPAVIPEWETVFAITIHKSQGSEFDKVLVILPKNQENRILTRELLYTGITRAKEKAIIQSSLDLIKSTTEKAVNRVSGIQERILFTSNNQ